MDEGVSATKLRVPLRFKKQYLGAKSRICQVSVFAQLLAVALQRPNVLCNTTSAVTCLENELAFLPYLLSVFAFYPYLPSTRTCTLSVLAFYLYFPDIRTCTLFLLSSRPPTQPRPLLSTSAVAVVRSTGAGRLHPCWVAQL